MQTYPIARYHFVFKVRETIHLPEYAGSMLRGAFGQALKRTACMIREKNCKDCPLYNTCPYTAIFEAPAPKQHILQKFSQIPAPYIIEPPEWGKRTYAPGEKISFSTVLIGRALEQLALVTYAWKRAFMREVGHGKADLLHIFHETKEGQKNIYDNISRTLADHDNTLLLEIPLTQKVTLKFYTPLRLQDNGHALPAKKLSARRFIIALVRRIALLSEFHMKKPITTNFQELSVLAEQIKETHHLVWKDWTRYSSRQQKTMQLGGVIGEWNLFNVPKEFMLFLYLGQWLHVGKNATFGLGNYKLENT